MLIFALVAVGAFAAFEGQASASPGHYRILVVHSTVGTVTGFKAALAAFPDVSVVDDFDAQASPPPTAAQLEAYDMVVGVEDAQYQDLTDYGNALADYVDSGGVVVQYAYENYNNSTAGANYGPAGRFFTGGYAPFVPGDNTDHSRSLGTFDASSPLMQGVASLTADEDTTPTLASGASLVASWNDGAPAVAVKGRVVSVSAYVADGVSWTGDYGRLTVNAVRTLGAHTLTVSLNGSGSGTVTSSPAGINCGPTCAANYANGSTVTLTATPSVGSTFAGWSGGGCSGTDTCTVLMSAAQAVTATFNPIPAAAPTAPVTAISPVVVPTAARVSSASVSNRVFADSASPNLVTTASQRRRVGTTIRYTLDKPASVRFDFTQPSVGRDVNGKCVAQNGRNTRKGKCALTLVRGSLAFAGHTGQNTVKFDGWLSKHKHLKPGNYTLVVTATTPGVGSTSRKLTFTIVK